LEPFLSEGLLEISESVDLIHSISQTDLTANHFDKEVLTGMFFLRAHWGRGHYESSRREEEQELWTMIYLIPFG
jgi:hypothetical protein